jgi:TolA-binding protein
MQDILLVIPLLLLLTLLLINKKTVERLTNDTCDITDRKIKLLEEKMKIEKIQSRELPNSEMTERINQLDEKITELNEKISKQSEEKKEKELEEKELEEKELEEEEKELEEEEEIYSGISAWNTLIEDNYVINGILIFFIFFLASVSIYLFFTSAFAYNKKNQLKLDKMNVKYDNILDDIKKSKVKDSLKIKKGSFFNFLKK